MRYETLPASDIPPEIETVWRDFQATNPAFEAPHFSIAFARAVGRHRRDACVSVIEQDGAIAGLFAFHRRRGGVGQPLSGPMSDYQAVLAPPSVTLTQDQLLQAAGLNAFDFNHALACQPVFADAALRHVFSPALDLSDGFDAWRANRMAATGAIRKVEKKRRRLERDAGPLRLVADDQTPGLWDILLRWKRAALAARGIKGYITQPWEAAVLEDIRATHDEDFAGVVSTLYAGDRPVAIHFGMRSRTVLHWWFASYDVEAGPYSPGLILLLDMARHLDTTPLQRIDLGRGDQRYKLEFANSVTPLCEGALTRIRSPAGAVRRLRRTLHGLSTRLLSPHYNDLQRRAVNRLLGAGRLGRDYAPPGPYAGPMATRSPRTP